MSPVASAWGRGAPCCERGRLQPVGSVPAVSPRRVCSPEETQTQQEQNERSPGLGHWDHTGSQPWEVGHLQPKPGRVPPAS